MGWIDFGFIILLVFLGIVLSIIKQKQLSMFIQKIIIMTSVILAINNKMLILAVILSNSIIFIQNYYTKDLRLNK